MRYEKIWLPAVSGVLILAFQNCSKVGFANAGDAGEVVTSIGQCSVSTTKEALRIIFMVDNSSSTDTTDPSKINRITSLQNFLATYSGHQNLSYGFGYFSGTSAMMFDKATQSFSDNAAVPFGTSSDLASALDTFERVGANSNTPYKAAFDEMNAAITADSTGGVANYVIIFMSDGAPTDLSSDIDGDIAGLVDQVSGAVKAKGRLLTVSTVYFGPESDTAAQSHLKLMSSDASGEFTDTNLTTQLNVEDVITVPGC